MEKRGYHLNYRDLVKDRLSASELQKLIGKHDHEDFLNPRSEVFRKKKMDDNPPARWAKGHWLDGQESGLDPPPGHCGRRARGDRIRRERNDPVLERFRT